MLADGSVIASYKLHLVTLTTRAQIVQYQKLIHILYLINYLHTWSNMELSDVLTSTWGHPCTGTRPSPPSHMSLYRLDH